MKPLTAALLSAAVALVVACATLGAALQFGWLSTGTTTLGAPVAADDDLGRQIQAYFAAHPELLGGGAAPATSFTPAQRAEVARIVRQALLDNPEMIREAMDALEKKTAAAEAAQQKTAIAVHKATLFNAPAPRQAVLGNPSGDVTLVEFFDYNCSYCRRSQADMDRLIREDGNLRVVMKEFPVLGPGSVEAAQVSVAVNMIAPEKYAAFHNRMLTDTAQATGERALAIAAAVGLDKEAVRAATKNAKIGEAINEVYALANALALTGTPSYVVGDAVVVGAVGYDALKAKIDAVRACGSATC